MESPLRFVVVIPAGGGKTTLAQKPGQPFLDVDALYNLRETQSTYDRINAELERRAAVREPVPVSVVTELKNRIANYNGPASCLLLHSLTLAEACGLELLAVVIPASVLHETSIAARNNTGKWFARQNVSCLVERCKLRSVTLSHYSTWTELDVIVKRIVLDLPTVGSNMSNHKTRNTNMTDNHKAVDDESALLAMCSLAIGCDIEGTEARS